MKFKKVHTKKKVNKKIVDLDENPYVEPERPVFKKRGRGRPRLDDSEKKSASDDKFAYYVGELYVAVSKNGDTGSSVYPWEAINNCIDAIKGKKKKISIGKPKPVQIAVYSIVGVAEEGRETDSPASQEELNKVIEYNETLDAETINKPKLFALVWSDQKFGPGPGNRRGGARHRVELKPYVPRLCTLTEDGVEFEIIKGKGKKKKKKVRRFAKKHLPALKKKFPKLKFKRKK
jgi:hypothetical protein